MTAQLNFSLNEGEDRPLLEAAVLQIKAWLADGRAKLFGYGDWADLSEKRNFCPSVFDNDVVLEAIQGDQAGDFLAIVKTAAGERLLFFHYPLGTADKLLSKINQSPAALAHSLYLDSLSTPVVMPKSYGFIEIKEERKLVGSVQVLAPLPAFPTLGEVISRELAADNSQENRNRIFRTLARQLALIHQANFYHPAMRPCHLLWLPGDSLAASGTQTVCRLLLLGTNKARFLRDMPSDRRVVNLSQFYRYALFDATESERYRFIEAYCQFLPIKSLEAEDLYRRVVHHYQEVALV